jgi:hypothetical protein
MSNLLKLVLLEVIIVIFFFGHNTAQAFATSSSPIWIYNYNGGTTASSGWTDEANITGENDSVIGTHIGYNGWYTYATASANLPANAVINSVATTFYNGSSGSGSTLQAFYIGGLVYCNDGSLTVHFNNSSTETLTYNASNCNGSGSGHGWSDLADVDNWNIEGLRTLLYIINNSTTPTIKWDAIKVVLDYSVPNPQAPTIELSTLSSTESGYLRYNLSGNIGYTSNTLTACEVKIYQQELASGESLIIPGTLGAEATVILWNSNLTSYTQVFPNNVYIGHGYSTTSDTWYGDGIKMHYYPNNNTNFKYDIACYEQYGTGQDVEVYHQQGLNSLLPDWNNLLISTPSSTQNEPTGGISCEAGDILCGLKTWFVETMEWLFAPSVTSVNDINAKAKVIRETKVPWVYVDTLLGLSEQLAPDEMIDNDLSDIVLVSSASGILADFSDVPGFMPDLMHINVQFTPFVTNIFGIIRGFFNFVVWAYFVLYIVLRFRKGII